MTSRRKHPFNGSKLLLIRTVRGLRQQDLSDKTAATGRGRIERATISRYENGESIPSSRNFGTLVEALACDPMELLDEPEAGAA